MNYSGGEVVNYGHNQLERMADDIFSKLGMPRMDFGNTI